MQPLDNVLKERELYLALSKDSTILDPKTTFDRLLSISEELEPSLVLGNGGWLLEMYILRCGRTKDYKELLNV